MQALALRALHEDAQSLLSVMHIFISEPLLDWMKPAGMLTHPYD
jgi:hypothetical protein